MESLNPQDEPATDLVGIVYPDGTTAATAKYLPPCPARGDRLKQALSKFYDSKKAMYLELDVPERSLSRWLAGESISTNYAKKLASILIENESEHLARWVFLGAEKRNMTDTAPQADNHAATVKLNGEPVDAFHVELIKAYRGLPVLERLNLAAQVLGLPTLANPDTETDTSGHLNGQPLDDHEKAIILKLRVIRPASIAITLISRLIAEANAH